MAILITINRLILLNFIEMVRLKLIQRHGKSSIKYFLRYSLTPTLRNHLFIKMQTLLNLQNKN